MSTENPMIENKMPFHLFQGASVSSSSNPANRLPMPSQKNRAGLKSVSHPVLMIGKARRVSSSSSSPNPSDFSLARHCSGLLKRINHYTLRATIGSGSSAKVYLGIDERTSERFAVKRIRLSELARDQSGLAQLEREIRLMSIFDHPNCLKIREVLHVPATDDAYIVLEYADKGSLGSLLDHHHPIPLPAILSIMKQVSSAIQYLHVTGYVHQDIKPCNILINATGRAMLADFGIGHSFDSATMVVGSPAYQAPEALDDDFGEEDDTEPSAEGPQKEDIWALGVTFYQLLFQKLPFPGSNLFEVVNYAKANPLDIPEDTDQAIAELLRAMLTIDPLNRIAIDDFCANPLITSAEDLAVGIPDVPGPVLRTGDIVEVEATVCSEGYSFAATRAPPRRFSFQAAYSPDLNDHEVVQVPRKLSASHSDDRKALTLSRSVSGTVNPQRDGLLD
jgi:serine/threonine protein kinase